MTGLPEIWLPVRGYEAEYEVSSEGRVRSIRRVLTNSLGVTRLYGGKVLKERDLSGAGHMSVAVCKGNKPRTAVVHVLVCEAFHGPKPADKDLVAHWDGNPSNNRPDNVRWATYLENEEDKRRHDRHTVGERNPAHKLTADGVADIRRRYRPKYGAGAALAREFGVSRTQISAIVNGHCWSESGNATRRARRAATGGAR